MQSLELHFERAGGLLQHLLLRWQLLYFLQTTLKGETNEKTNRIIPTIGIV
jgi:hypothetical protein